ncbi:DAG protein, chloroplast precursor [Musa troglodytarum]|uniref:DAG protein, chloroplast n=1 Tax=Musa troglodytarum TaxID=320322 RepID=A0A9E7IBQ6_9LILI|nr:DAG protein, chloroplast precursor [Musa troglodytarum]
MAGRTFILRLQSMSLSPLLSSRALAIPPVRFSPLLRVRPLLAAASYPLHLSAAGLGTRCFSTRPTTSSLNDPSPNWSNRPPKETILLDGCDFEHWLVVVEPPDPSLTRDEIIDSYIKTLAQVLGSEEEARMSIYSVSTKHYFAFGCKVSEEISYKIKPLPKVRWVLPDSYLDVKNKDYGGEPFIDGKAVPYDPKYHEEWVRNNARAQERSRRNDRPRNFDRSRNFERRRENMQNFQNRPPPMANQDFQNHNAQNTMPPNAQNPMPPRDAPPMPNREYNATPPTAGGMTDYQNQTPNPQNTYVPNAGPSHQGSVQGYQGYQGGSPGGNMPGYVPNAGPSHQGGVQGYQGYQGGSPGGNMPGYVPNAGPSHQGGVQGYQGYQGGSPQGNMPGRVGYQGSDSGYHGGGPAYQGGSPGYQGGNPPYQGGFSGYQPGSTTYQGGNPNYQQGGINHQGGAPAYQGRDVSGRDE